MALWLRYNGPDTTLSFSIMIDILLMVVIGGMGTMYGAVIGAALFVAGSAVPFVAQAVLQGIVVERDREAVVASLDPDPAAQRLVRVALTRDDEVVTTSHEYNACKNALDVSAERAGARVVVADVDGDGALDLALAGSQKARRSLSGGVIVPFVRPSRRL